MGRTCQHNTSVAHGSVDFIKTWYFSASLIFPYCWLGGYGSQPLWAESASSQSVLRRIRWIFIRCIGSWFPTVCHWSVGWWV